jgi:FLVCR family MFS transporter 7
MNDIAPVETHSSTAKGATQVEEDVHENAQGSSSRAAEENGVVAETSRSMFRRRPQPKQTYSHAHFKVYKRRWPGLAQLVLLNIVASWDVSCQQEPILLISGN